MRVTVFCIYLASVLAALGLILLAYFILREMTLREKYRAQIKQREEWFRVTLTSIGDGVIATDERGVVTFLNPVAERLTGRAVCRRPRASRVNEVFPIFNEVSLRPVENPVRKVMESGQIVGLANHTVVRHRNGSLIPIEDSAAPIRDDAGRLVGVVLVFRDATSDRKSQEILRKTEKIAAAARLAATVAHEINNPLEAVSNLIYLAKLRAGMPAQALRRPDPGGTGTEPRVARHAADARLLSRSESARQAGCAGDRGIGAAALLQQVQDQEHPGAPAKLEPCPPLQGWPGELQQVIANLISNAADAVEHGRQH